ncbi:MAG: ceramidase domain-containing protein [Thermoanaerobaculia bacterium]
MNARSILLGAALLVLLVAVFVVAPKAQNQSYHLFADTEPFGSIPNSANVLSNLAFLAVGIWGLAVVLSPRKARAIAEPWEQRAYALFFAAIGVTAIGSAYYHWNPDDQTLFWDRLPMTVAFTSLAAIVISERIDSRTGSRLFLPLVAFGLATVLAWRSFGDLRPYVFLQAATLLVVLISTIFFRSRASHGIWMAGLLAGYAAALLFELLDRQVKDLLVFTGGHPLKHLAAAAGTACVVVMLLRRAAVRAD